MTEQGGESLHLPVFLCPVFGPQRENYKLLGMKFAKLIE